jgi:hypothetical protein
VTDIYRYPDLIYAFILTEFSCAINVYLYIDIFAIFVFPDIVTALQMVNSATCVIVIIVLIIWNMKKIDSEPLSLALKGIPMLLGQKLARALWVMSDDTIRVATASVLAV